MASDRASGCGLDDDGFRDIIKFDLKRSNLSEPHHLPFSSPHFCSTTRNNPGSLQMQGMVSGLRGPFTPSQWMELEHQAVIYKYITANVPIPSYLLNPIRKAFQSAADSALRSNTLGWGVFNLGYCNGDPEPGRCRRTDGKKWRCSRDAVPDQKYCDRHMNRGRHRSRKPVEGQSADPKPPDFGIVNPQHPVRKFIDDWPNNRTNQLSISMSDFTSPKLAPNELEMGLAVGAAAQRQFPISWELPMGGPLGEALHTPAEMPLNLIDNGASRPPASSPMGVLQRGTLSNCSGRSSPRCNGINAPGALTDSFLPAL